MNPGGFDISSLTRQTPASMAAAAAAFMANQGQHNQHNPLMHSQQFSGHHVAHQAHQAHLTGGHGHYQQHHQQQHQWTPGLGHNLNHLGMGSNPIHGAGVGNHHPGHHVPPPHHLSGHHLPSASHHHSMSPMAHLSSMSPSGHLMHGSSVGSAQPTVTHIPTPHHMQSQLMQNSALAAVAVAAAGGSSSGHGQLHGHGTHSSHISSHGHSSHHSASPHLSSNSPHSTHSSSSSSSLITSGHQAQITSHHQQQGSSIHGHHHQPTIQSSHAQPRLESVQPQRPDSVQPLVPPPPSSTPAPPPPVMSDANNQLASGVNLSSIQSLVDVLVELPLPSEGPESDFKRPQLIHDQNVLHHVSNIVSPSIESQTHVSQILGPAMASAKQSLDSLDLNFLDPMTSLSITNPNELVPADKTGSSSNKSNSNNQSNNASGVPLEPKCSHVQVQNSYLLSLLNSMDCFSNAGINLPPAASIRQTRSQQAQQQSYWNPWEGQQQQQQQEQVQVPLQEQYQQQQPVIGSTATGTLASGVSPSQFSNHATINQNSNNLQSNNIYSHAVDNNNSNSNSNFAMEQQLLQQQQSTVNQGIVTQTYQQQQPVVNQYQDAMQYQNSGYNQQDPNLDVKSLNTEPMIVLDKLDVDQALLDYYKSTNGPSSENGDPSAMGNLASDRNKSSKRPRTSESESSPPKKSRKGSTTTMIPGINVGEDGAIIPYYPDEDSDVKPSRSVPSTPSKSPAKAQSNASSYASHVPRRHVPHSHTSPAKVSTKTTHSYISSTYLSSTANDGPQLESQSSNLPAPEKFEAMLDELFDLNKDKMGSLNHKDESDSDDDDGSDDERRRKKKKAKKNKMNGGDNVPAIFDITLSGSTLNALVALTAKLKRNGQTANAPANKLSSLLTILTQQLAIQSAGLKDKRRRSSVEEKDAGSDEDDEDTNITTSTSMMHKFEACCDCCLIALHILSSKGMTSRIYLEECIEQIIAFLNATIQQYTTIGGATSASSSPTKGSRKSPKKLAANNYISPTVGANKKILSKMYTKWSELIGLLVELLTLRSGSLTDTLVLSTTRLALGAFFLENLSSGSGSSVLMSGGSSSNEIQLNALKLTTTIFSQYSPHRGVILDELLSSIAKLPTTKRNKITYKVDGDSDGSSQSISMFSALLLQLIQSLFVKRKEPGDEDESGGGEGDMKKSSKDKKVNIASLLKTQYDSALRVACTFLSTFLRKCCGLAVAGQAAAADQDYRVLFEGLVSDLMITLHKPNWPASQLLTQVLVKILITNITPGANTKGPKAPGGSGGASAQLNLKLASLDHLGTICSRFAKELSDVNGLKDEVKNSLNVIINGDDEQENNDDTDVSDGEETANNNKKKKTPTKKRRSKRKIRNEFMTNDESLSKEIWKHLIRFFDEEGLLEEKNLLVSIWLREMKMESDAAIKTDETNEDESGAIIFSQQEKLDQKIKAFMALYRKAANRNLEEDEYVIIDPKTAELIIRFLDISQNTTVKLFDAALGHVIAALSTTSNTMMRSRAMKSLSTILNNAHRRNATALLARSDLQKAMRCALLDTSTSVREATIDLIGKFILNGQSEDLIEKYFDLITERVLDTGVSVRKRVIKILREICIMYPSYQRVPEICSKIIKRINDDGEGIRKLVTETFTTMWFKEERSKEAVRLKVACINHVVATVLTERIGTEWLQQLLTNLFQSNADKKKTVTELEEDDDKPAASAQQLAQVTNSSAQIIDILISEILCGDNESSSGGMSGGRSAILSAVTTIWLFGKVAPQLLLNHVSTLHPYLQIKCTTQLDIMVLSKVVQILELVLPKLSNPSESLLSRIEEDLTKNIIQNNASVLDSCVSCLSTVIHKHSKNTQLAQELFKKFFDVLVSLSANPDMIHTDTKFRPRLLRALFTCGLFAKHFDFLKEKQQLYEIFVKYVYENRAVNLTTPGSYGVDTYSVEPKFKKCKDGEVLLKALTGLGFMFERNPQFTLKSQTQDIYKDILSESSDVYPVAYQEMTKTTILKNMTNYLSDEFNNEMANKVEWSKENLKSMVSEEGDSNSLQSTIIQCYLADVTRCTLSPILNVRRAAVNLVHIIHNGGHVHPLQLVPYLIAMSSDDDTTIRCRADHVLNEIERKYHGFVSMKSKIGVHLAYQLHSHSGRRGYRVENINLSAPSKDSSPEKGAGKGSKAAKEAEHADQSDDKHVTGRLSTLYSVVSGNRQSRRAFITGLLKYFDVASGGAGSTSYNDVMTNVNIGGETSDIDHSLIQQFVCDNIIWLPYSLWDEPLYILQQLDMNLSLLASHLQSQFKEALHLTDDDDDELDQPEKEVAAPKKKRSGSDDGSTDTEDEEDQKKPAPSIKLSGNNGIDAAANALLEGMGSEVESLLSAVTGSNQQPVMTEILNTDAFLPKPMPSMIVVNQLVKTLKAFYMLFWSKHLMRELFAITDLKLQDYSPNENQKVWDKPVHRRAVDLKTLEKLMKYPGISIVADTYDENLRDVVMAEYKRFKNLQVTGTSGNEMSSKVVMQLMQQPAIPGKNEADDLDDLSAFVNLDKFNDVYEQQPQTNVSESALPNISNEYAARLIQQIKRQESNESYQPSVNIQALSTTDIKGMIEHHDSQVTPGHSSSAASTNPSLKMTISVNKSKALQKKKKDKKKKKKKHRRYDDSSDEDEEDDDSPSDDYSEDDYDDDYE